MSTAVQSRSQQQQQDFRYLKVVDKSNAFSKFSNRKGVRVESTVFRDAPIPSHEERPAVRARSPNHTDPFSDSRQTARPGGLKIVVQPEATVRKFSKKISGFQAPVLTTADEKAFTFQGTPYGGRVTFPSRNAGSDSDAFDRSQQRSQERFRKTQQKQESCNVLKPDTLADVLPKEKVQRFLNSTKYAQPTLQGVLNPSPSTGQMASYKVVPPWHTAS